MTLTKEEQKRITTAVDEAARLLKDNPTWTYKQAIAKAKEITEKKVV
ncbi:hypothetical protein [Paratissierella segnis]|jgi:hypothetical protein|uniref:Uncharacterized protein n=1 Tax=Paratissierella segnis TaxID=2763679 RepID=A0A926EVM7_9FIRM|nr:hypothetical protein [Paratissierella segnis]MBC8589355.1 hypothetical protein [Paratissierella segnis]